MPQSDLFARGLQAHQAGKLSEAEALYRQVLAANARHADAWHLWGALCLQTGNPEAALEKIDTAIKFSAENPLFRSNRGLALGMLGRWGEAEEEFRKAVELSPEFFDAWLNLGNLKRSQRDYAAAAECYLRAATLRPRDAAVLNNLGAMASDAGRDDEAEAFFRQVLAINSNQVKTWNNLGVILLRKGSWSAAREALLAGLKIEPDDPDLLTNLAGVYERTGDCAAAEETYHRVFRLTPSHAPARGNYGSFLRSQGRIADAAVQLRSAIAANPSEPDYFNNLGLVFHAEGKLHAASECYRHGLKLRPTHARMWNNLGVTLWAAGELPEALSAYESAIKLNPSMADVASNRLLALHSDRSLTPESLCREHLAWGERFARPLYPGNRSRSGPRRGGRIRVGYVSPDFRMHALRHFIGPVLETHDRHNYEVFAYADVRAADDVTRRFARMVENWVLAFPLSDEELAQRILHDRIDVLVDLAGHTAGNRLLVFARGSAPVQATFLGYPNTSGIHSIDYRLTDNWADPPDMTEKLHSETIVRLSRTAWCYGPPPDSPPVAPVPASRNGRITFGCFNSLSKLSDDLLRVWARIMVAVPTSRILLKAQSLAEPAFRLRQWERFESVGVSRERLLLAGWESDLAGHLGRYGDVDIALDTFPYHGTTTTCEALWMGVPVITLAGRSHVARVGVSLLHNVGLPQYVAETEDDYVALATALANRPDELQARRSSLRQMMLSSPLCDARAYTKELEAVYAGWTSAMRKA